MRGIVVLGACAVVAACTGGVATSDLGGDPGPGLGGGGTGSSDDGSDSGSSATGTATSAGTSDGGGDTDGTTTSAGTSSGVTTSTPDNTSTTDDTSSTTDDTSSTMDATTSSTMDTTMSSSDTTTSSSDTTTSSSNSTSSTTDNTTSSSGTTTSTSSTTSSSSDTTTSTSSTTSSSSDTTTSTTSSTTTTSSSDECANVDFGDDFSGGQGLWTHAPTSGIPGDDPWQIGAANKGGVTCNSGSSCWATYLTGVYTGCETGELVSPVIDLSACAASGLTVQLSFWQWYEYEGTPVRWWDGGMVQISSNGGTSWTDVTPSPGYQGTIDGGDTCSPPGSGEIEGHQGWSGLTYGNFWHQVTVNIVPAFRTSNFRVRFVHGTDPATQEYGWLIDDFAVTTF